MTLFKTTDTLPQHKPGWSVWGRTARNILVPMGEYPRLTIGERLLSKYKQYHHVHIADQVTKFDCKARSATGEMYFSVHFSVNFKVKHEQIERLLQATNPIEGIIHHTLTQEAEDMSEGYEAEDDRGFQAALKQALSPQFGGGMVLDPFELVRVNIRVQVPKGVRAEAETYQISKTLDADIATAEALGNREEADRLRRAREAWAEASRMRADHSILSAEQALKMQNLINRMSDEGVPLGADVIQSMTENQSQMVKPDVNHGQGRAAIPKQEQKRLTSDNDDDDDDLN